MMGTLRSHSSSTMNAPTQLSDVDISMFMDTTQDFEPSDGTVRWVASQSHNPALQALIKEAECEKRTRPSTPVNKPVSWTYPLPSTSSSTSLSTSVASSWHSSGHDTTDISNLLPLSQGSSSSSSLAPASDPSVSRRTKPTPATQRKSLASSTSSTNQPVHDFARPRSSSRSTTLSNPSTSRSKYTPQEEEPEAMAFIELLKDVSRQLDQNSEKKQRLVARVKEKEREGSLERSGIDNRTGSDTSKPSARPLAKTSSASAICPAESLTRRLGERTSGTAMSAFKHEPRGQALAKTSSLGALAIDVASGKSTPASLPGINLNSSLKPALTVMSDTLDRHPIAARKASELEYSPNDGDTAMQDVIDLTSSDTEWEKPMSGVMSRTLSATHMQVDEDDTQGDTTMDMSFIQPEPLSLTRVGAPKPRLRPSQPNAASRPPPPTQHTPAGPPPLGMRRAPQLLTPQYGSSQGSKGVTVRQFKPPLLASGVRATKLAVMTSSRLPPRSSTTKVAATKTTVRGSQDADSSFDVSFDVDADALEETMKAYD